MQVGCRRLVTGGGGAITSSTRGDSEGGITEGPGGLFGDEEEFVLPQSLDRSSSDPVGDEDDVGDIAKASAL